MGVQKRLPEVKKENPGEGRPPGRMRSMPWEGMIPSLFLSLNFLKSLIPYFQK